MSVTVHTFGGVDASVYYLDRGETIPRHQHRDPHTTGVIVGMAEVDVFDGRPTFQMRPQDNCFILPADIDHEIRALENGTIIINMGFTTGRPTNVPRGPQPEPARAPDGGLTLHEA